MTGFEYEFVKIAKEEKEEYKKNTYSLGVFPYLQDSASGEGFGESLAIARFMCNTKSESGLYGTTAYETGLIDQVIDRHVFANSMTLMKVLGPVLGFGATTEEQAKEFAKKAKDYFKQLDGELKDKSYFVGDRLTLADVYIAVSMNLFVALFLDAGFRKALPNLMKWYDSVRNEEALVSVLGKPRYCGKALKAKTE